MLSALSQLLRRAAWAPVAVLIFHAVIAKTSLRVPLDFTIHFLGGASMAYFLSCALDVLPMLFGRVAPAAHYLFAFALACTVGLFWEFAEYASDVFRHTHIQQSLHETMSDLIADATGATTSLLLVFLSRAVWRLRREPRD